MTVTRLPNHVTDPDGCIGSVELCYRSRVSHRQLDFWTRGGYIKALPVASPGRGTPRFYSREEAAALVLMARLVADGLGPRQAAHHARRLLEWGTTSIAGMSLHLPDEL